MPIYNGEKYLSQAIESVLNQECKDLELLLINDGSTDKSELICQKYEAFDKRVKYYKKKNSGVSDTRNFGIKNANGEYIAFLDCDDAFCKDFYTNKFYNKLKSSNSDIASLGFIWADQNLKKGILVTSKLDSNYSQRFSSANNTFCSFIYRKNILQKVSFNTNFAYSEDFDFLLRALGYCESISFHPELLFAYRNNKYSATHTMTDSSTDCFLPHLSIWPQLLFFFESNEIKNKERAIDHCIQSILSLSSRFISESIIKNIPIDHIEDSIYRYIKKEQLFQFEKKHPNTVINGFLTDFKSFYTIHRKNNRLRILVAKIGLNKVKLLRKIFVSTKYTTDLRNYI